MRQTTLLVFTLLALPALSYASDCPICESIQEHLSTNFPSTKVQAVNPAPMIGMYEVVMGNNIMYTDQAADLFMVGHIFNPKTNKDLTAERLTNIQRVSFEQLPLEDAIVSGDQGGKKLAIFTDPDCPYCQKLESILQRLHGVEVYTFLMPLAQLHPDAKRKSNNIWCSSNQHKALIDSMMHHKIIPDKACSNPIERNLQLAQSLGISGTPTLISEKGKIMNGLPKDEQVLLEWLK